MGADKSGWYYVGSGQLRYMDSDGWTAQYKTIESPRSKASQPPVVVEAESQLGGPGARSRGRSALWLAMAALVVIGGTGFAFASGAVKPGGLQSFLSAVPSLTDAAPAKASLKPSPVWDGGGYKKADYAKRVGGIPVLVGDVRGGSGNTLATHVDLMGLGFQFNEIGKLPAPPKVDPTWWAANNTALSKLSQQAADEWAEGDREGAMVRFEVVVKKSNTLITKVNKAFGLRILRSKTAA